MLLHRTILPHCALARPMNPQKIVAVKVSKNHSEMAHEVSLFYCFKSLNSLFFHIFALHGARAPSIREVVYFSWINFLIETGNLL